jgi:hypothetical protein
MPLKLRLSVVFAKKRSKLKGKIILRIGKNSFLSLKNYKIWQRKLNLNAKIIPKNQIQS